jgi:integrase
MTMAVHKDKDGQWRYRKRIVLLDGSRERISGTPACNTKVAAEQAERAHIERALNPSAKKKEVPKFSEWFNGRFWEEWVVARKNKPSEVESKRGIYECHLKDEFGGYRLEEIDEAKIARLRARLVRANRTEKTINNVLAVLSKSLHYAKRVRLIDTVPEIGLFKVERPEIESWSWDEYARITEAAKRDYEPEWYVAICLAGEAGLRIGEIKALRWREDVDLAAGTLTVQQQVRHGKIGTPKGRTRRTIPLNSTVLSALKGMSEIRLGYVLRDLDGNMKKDNAPRSAMDRILKKAGLPPKGWHLLRHTFGTHAAMLGVNPWSLMTWMGHKTITETLRYVHVANAHRRSIPEAMVTAAGTELDPDRRILKMLAARVGNRWPKEGEAVGVPV